MGNADIVRNLWQAVNAGGPEAMRAWLAEDFVRHEGDRQLDREQWIEILVARWKAFPDNQSRVIDAFAAGDKVAYRWESEGTHRETYERVPPTGKRVMAQGITISVLRDGRIVEEWASWNKSSVLHALGVLPIA